VLYTVILATIQSTFTFSIHIFYGNLYCTINYQVYLTARSLLTVNTDINGIARSRFTGLIKGYALSSNCTVMFNSNHWRIFHGRFMFYRGQLQIFQGTFTLCRNHWCNFKHVHPTR